MNLQLEELDVIEAPIDTEEGVVIVAMALAAGILVGMIVT